MGRSLPAAGAGVERGWVGLGWAGFWGKESGVREFFLHLKVLWHRCSVRAGCCGTSVWSIAAWRRVPGL